MIFVHEYAADCRTWESQVRCLSRQYRCITFNARGYPPSDVPSDPASYGWEHAADDVRAVIEHLGIRRAHVVGLSMGAYAALMFAVRHPGIASALVLAGIGSGSPPSARANFQASSALAADRLEREGMAPIAEEMGVGPTRVQLQNKDPRGWAEFMSQLREHSARGSALTMRHYQGQRPSLFEFERQFAALADPTLIVVGDEDEPCIETSLFLKRVMPNAGLWMLPRTGHGLNLEEPDAFNRGLLEFFGMAERGRALPRDPRSRVAR